MSIEAVSYVLGHSTAKGAAWQVLVVLAETADRNGRDAYPSRQLIAVRTNLDESSVKRAFITLIRDGWIVADGHSSRGTQKWQIVMDGHATKTLRDGRPAVSAPGAQRPPGGHSAPEEGAHSPAPGAHRPAPRGTAPPKPPLTLIEPREEPPSRASTRRGSSLKDFAVEICGVLERAIDSIPNDDEDMTRPTADDVERILRRHRPTLAQARDAAAAAKAITQKHNRAPNIAGLFNDKLAELIKEAA